MTNHEHFMARAVELAKIAYNLGEVPVGALLVINGVIVAEGHNRREMNNSVLEHAELSVLQQASHRLQRWRLTDATLYSTLEPCIMCAGALVHSRISCVVYGAKDSKFGGIESLYSMGQDARLNHQFTSIGGIKEHECASLMRSFFASLRSK